MEYEYVDNWQEANEVARDMLTNWFESDLNPIVEERLPEEVMSYKNIEILISRVDVEEKRITGTNIPDDSYLEKTYQLIDRYTYFKV